ncbi:hypothetical protein PIB30_055744 [Stylosanthes scabra]|uniref:BURP domain-containing protein n=1 Tax=Stylosanthes scabra TaxID=79078 RepID=A0ABU6SJ94_9FABA|nr:hypothetical protein [Stylosanthes scabra]
MTVSHSRAIPTPPLLMSTLVAVWSKHGVEQRMFFYESMLKEGTIMLMPDIMDKIPTTLFLPRSILSKLSFSTSELKRIFKESDESIMDMMIKDSVEEYTSAPVGQRQNGVLDSTKNLNDSKKHVMVDNVKGINGTNYISCHKELFSYLLYYCHFVPETRVYEPDLLDPNRLIPKLRLTMVLLSVTWTPLLRARDSKDSGRD